MLKFKIDYEDAALQNNTANYGNKVEDALSKAIAYNESYAQGWMRQNAPWTDRTGAARSGLMAIAFNQGGVHELLLAYSVYYGIWLEIANSGRYQILIPAMRIIGQKILEDVARILNQK